MILFQSGCCRPGQFSCAYFKQSKCPYRAASEHVSSSHGQSFSCAYFKQSVLPIDAASLHVSSFHGHPFSCAYFKQSRFPFSAATEHVSSSHGNPASRKRRNSSTFPNSAASRHEAASSRLLFTGITSLCRASRSTPHAVHVRLLRPRLRYPRRTFCSRFVPVRAGVPSRM